VISELSYMLCFSEGLSPTKTENLAGTLITRPAKWKICNKFKAADDVFEPNVSVRFPYSFNREANSDSVSTATFLMTS